MFPPAFLILIGLAMFLFWCESSTHFDEIGQKIIDFFTQFKENQKRENLSAVSQPQLLSRSSSLCCLYARYGSLPVMSALSIT